LISFGIYTGLEDCLQDKSWHQEVHWMEHCKYELNVAFEFFPSEVVCSVNFLWVF
ncbi:unnamed protein product, partial [Prunus brigantina]